MGVLCSIYTGAGQKTLDICDLLCYTRDRLISQEVFSMKTLVAVLLTLALLVGVGTIVNAQSVFTDNGGVQVPIRQVDSLPLGTPTETVLIYTELPCAPEPEVLTWAERWGTLIGG